MSVVVSVMRGAGYPHEIAGARHDVVDRLPLAGAAGHLAAMLVAGLDRTPRQRRGGLERHPHHASESDDCGHLERRAAGGSDDLTFLRDDQVGLGGEHEPERAPGRDDPEWFEAGVEQQHRHVGVLVGVAVHRAPGSGSLSAKITRGLTG